MQTSSICNAPWRRWLSCGAALLLLGGCATNPVTGKKEIVLLSTSAEIDLGIDNYLTAQQTGGGQYTVDRELSEYVNTIGQRLSAVSDRKLPYEFVVLDDGTPNAWALPGGKIALNRGLLIALENEAELAAVVAHEIVHAAARHGAHAWQRGVLFSAIENSVAIAAQDSSDAQYAIGGANVALGLVGKKYSRSAELDADYYGMKYMHAAGYDARAAVTLQEKFVAFSKDQKRDWLDGLFASHPPSTERVKRNREALADFPPGGELGAARYLRATAHLRDTQSAYAQAARARQLLAKDSRAALGEIDAAIRRADGEPMFHGIRGHALMHQQRARDAVRAYDRAIALAGAPGYYEHFLGRGAARKQLGRTTAARRDLENSNALLPTAQATYLLAELAQQNGERDNAKQLFDRARAGGGAIGESAQQAFVKLDLIDAPHRYVRVQIERFDNQLIVHAQNSTDYTLRNITLTIETVINGKPHRSQQNIQRLAPRATHRIPFSVNPDDVVTATAQAVRIEAVQ